MSAEKIEPKLRFKEFNESWEENYLNQFFENRNERNFEDLEVLSVTINEGVLKRSELGSDRKNKDKKTMKHVLKGDLVYNPMFMWKGASGISSYEGITSADYVVLKSKENANTEFFSYLFQTKKSLNKFKNFSQGSLIERLRLLYPQFSNIKMSAPSYKEQEKIANFLSEIDKKIDLLEKKKNNLDLEKEYYLNNIMSRKIQSNLIPDNWQTYYLKDIAFVPKKKKLKKLEDEKLLTVKLHTKGVCINENTKPKLTERGRPYYKRYSDELLIGRQNFHNGGIGIVPMDLNGGVCSNAISSFCVYEDKITLKFLYYFLSRKNYYKSSEKFIGGTGQKEFSEKQLMKLKIKVPPLDEQMKITNFLDNLMQKSELNEEKLTLYKKYKNGLLQKMFV